MEDTLSNPMREEDEEECARVDLWQYLGGHIKIMVVRCAIELGIAEALERHGSPMTLLELSSAVGCDPSLLERVMRALVHFKIFKEKPTTTIQSKSESAVPNLGYAQTLLSKKMFGPGENSLAPMFLLVSSPVMNVPLLGLSSIIRGKNLNTNVNNVPVAEKGHGGDLWGFGEANPDHNKLFNESMACDSKMVMPVVTESCPELFQGVHTLVDVGGGDGTTLRLVVAACSWVQGICFDLPHVVAAAQQYDRIQMVGGDFFDSIPKADAVMLKWILHDWGDDECIMILKKCREAIPNDKGKVIIIDAVIDQDEEEDIIKEAKMMLDIKMMVTFNGGKERTLKQWEYVLGEAGFSRHTITPIRAVQSVIQAFP